MSIFWKDKNSDFTTPNPKMGRPISHLPLWAQILNLTALNSTNLALNIYPKIFQIPDIVRLKRNDPLELLFFSLRLWMNVRFLFSILLQWCLRCCYFEAIVPHFVPSLRIISLTIISDRIFTCIYEINCVVRFFFASSIKYMRNMEKSSIVMK